MSDDTTDLRMAMCDECSFVTSPAEIGTECNCGGEYVETSFTLKADLRELIEEWRTEGIQIHPGMPNISEALGEKAADDLEALLEGENE
jgi:hypothetical protein